MISFSLICLMLYYAIHRHMRILLHILIRSPVSRMLTSSRQLFRNYLQRRFLAKIPFTYHLKFYRHRREKHTYKIQWSGTPSSMLRFLPSSPHSLHQICLRHLLPAREIPSCNLRIDLYSGVGRDEMICHSTSASYTQMNRSRS